MPYRSIRSGSSCPPSLWACSAPRSTGAAGKARGSAAPDRLPFAAALACPFRAVILDRPMPNVPGLRSPYAKVGRLVYLGRMLDKIRLHAVGKLPPAYHPNLGDTQSHVFDARCCRFLGISYAAIAEHTRAGKTDQQVLAWAEANGAKRTDDECLVWC